MRSRDCYKRQRAENGAGPHCCSGENKRKALSLNYRFYIKIRIINNKLALRGLSKTKLFHFFTILNVYRMEDFLKIFSQKLLIWLRFVWYHEISFRQI